MTISTLSSSASSNSHAEALKKPRGLRAITFTFFAPKAQRGARSNPSPCCDTDDQHALAILLR